MADSAAALLVGPTRGWRDQYAMRSQPSGGAMMVVDPAVQDTATNMDLKVRQLIQHAQQQQQNGVRGNIANVAPISRQGGPVGDGKSTAANGIGKWMDGIFARPTANNSNNYNMDPSSYARDVEFNTTTDGTRLVSNPNSNNSLLTSLFDSQSTTVENANERRIRWLKWVAQNRYFIAVATGIIVIILLIMLNPPFVQKRSKNKLYRSTPDRRKIFFLGGIAMITTLVVPMFMDRPKK